MFEKVVFSYQKLFSDTAIFFSFNPEQSPDGD